MVTGDFKEAVETSALGSSLGRFRLKRVLHGGILKERASQGKCAACVFEVDTLLGVALQ